MYVTNITDVYDNITDLNFTNKFTITENIIDIFIPTFLLTKSCGPLFLCLMSLMVYTSIKPIINNK